MSQSAPEPEFTALFINAFYFYYVTLNSRSPRSQRYVAALPKALHLISLYLFLDIEPNRIISHKHFLWRQKRENGERPCSGWDSWWLNIYDRQNGIYLFLPERESDGIYGRKLISFQIFKSLCYSIHSVNWMVDAGWRVSSFGSNEDNWFSVSAETNSIRTMGSLKLNLIGLIFVCATCKCQRLHWCHRQDGNGK